MHLAIFTALVLSLFNSNCLAEGYEHTDDGAPKRRGEFSLAKENVRRVEAPEAAKRSGLDANDTIDWVLAREAALKHPEFKVTEAPTRDWFRAALQAKLQSRFEENPVCLSPEKVDQWMMEARNEFGKDFQDYFLSVEFGEYAGEVRAVLHTEKGKEIRRKLETALSEWLVSGLEKRTQFCIDAAPVVSISKKTSQELPEAQNSVSVEIARGDSGGSKLTPTEKAKLSIEIEDLKLKAKRDVLAELGISRPQPIVLKQAVEMVDPKRPYRHLDQRELEFSRTARLRKMNDLANNKRPYLYKEERVHEKRYLEIVRAELAMIENEAKIRRQPSAQGTIGSKLIENERKRNPGP